MMSIHIKQRGFGVFFLQKKVEKIKFGLITIYEYLNSKNNLLQIESNNLIAKYSFYLNSNMLNLNLKKKYFSSVFNALKY
ncbi:hypothetical protein EB1_24290 [Empedobacter brevis NBRC 14943 = ATCC 43319]|uniref:Uncharacterized protein n=1 Tax=Empedobacter brevis NBRC 14943 = ATCC 43319 TaxID=1218108 RepID=A0A511NIK5_9FLAO|nr:hypothetical protein EB1_24290 [Empedobacter brevis NBRC 14943 = ATCC 43319]